MMVNMMNTEFTIFYNPIYFDNFVYGLQIFASVLVVASLCSGVYSDVPPFAPLAPYAIAPFARSFNAHSIHHSLAVPALPAAAPIVAASPPYPLPLPYASPYFATL